MDAVTAHILNFTTQDFYLQTTQSFDQTRQQAWEGWQFLIDELFQNESGLYKNRLPNPCSLLDIGCGNLRFEKFLKEQIPLWDIDTQALDTCKPLVQCGMKQEPLDIETLRFYEVDIVTSLLDEDDEWLAALTPSDLVVAFGLMHHVPQKGMRKSFVERMLQLTKPGGFTCASFWQFALDEKRRTKAIATTQQALMRLPVDSQALEPNDYLLGWGIQDSPTAWRYCHSFSDEEINQLIEDTLDYAHVVADYKADGSSHQMNRYVVWQRE